MKLDLVLSFCPLFCTTSVYTALQPCPCFSRVSVSEYNKILHRCKYLLTSGMVKLRRDLQAWLQTPMHFLNLYQLAFLWWILRCTWGRTLLLVLSVNSADVPGRTGSVTPTQVWLFPETLLLRLFIPLAKDFPQGWFLPSLSWVSNPSAHKHELPCVRKIWWNFCSERWVCFSFSEDGKIWPV